MSTFFAVPITWQDLTPLTAEQLNANFSSVVAGLNSLQQQFNNGIVVSTLPSTANMTALTVYNFGQYNPSKGSSGQASQNDAAMTSLIAAINNASPNGGFAFVPAASFQLDPQAFSLPDQSIIHGMGNQVQPAMFVSTGSGTMFNINNPHNGGGTYLKHLSFQFPTSVSSSSIAVVANTWNNRAEYCNFINCPTAFSAKALSTGIRECTIYYLQGPNGGNTPATSTPQVVLNNPETFAVGPGQIFQTPISSGGPTGMTGVSIQALNEHAVIAFYHIDGLTYGINYAISGAQPNGAVNFSCVTSCEVAAYTTALYMQTDTASSVIYGERYIGNILRAAQPIGGSEHNTGPCIYIDTNSGSNNNVNDIVLLGNSSFQAFGTTGHGLQFNSGSGLMVGFSTFSGNDPTNGAGIALTGTCGNIIALGCIMRPTYQNAPAFVQAQKYALLVSGNISDVALFIGCDMNGYVSGPVSVTGTVGSYNGSQIVTNPLYVNLSPGYNDQGTVVSASAPTSSLTSAASKGFYGPSMVVFSNGSALNVTIQLVGMVSSVTVSMASGCIPMFSPYDKIEFSGAPSTFFWRGVWA